MTIVTVPKDFARDQWGRPLIKPPGGGKPVAYRRMTKFIDVIADRYKLEQWSQRQVAIGLAQREDLRLSVLAHLDDKDAVDRACKDAKEYAKASAAATNGTSFHTLTDIIDSGGTLPDGLPDNILRTLEAFQRATSQLKVIAIEPKTCHDAYKIAGTPDRVYEWRHNRFIGDTKTGTVRFGTQKIAAQLAGYAHSKLYDVETGKREEHGADTTRGIIMDVDLEACTVDLLWIDLKAGERALRVAQQVWDQRSVDKFEKLTAPFGGVPMDFKTDMTLKKALATPVRRPLAQQVAEASTRAELEALWAANEGVWDETLTAAAKERLSALNDLPTAV